MDTFEKKDFDELEEKIISDKKELLEKIDGLIAGLEEVNTFLENQNNMITNNKESSTKAPLTQESQNALPENKSPKNLSCFIILFIFIIIPIVTGGYYALFYVIFFIALMIRSYSNRNK